MIFGDLDFHVVESMPYTDRGGYGSTGSTSAEGQTAEGRTYRGANGLELHVGEYGIACGDDDCPAEYSMYSDLVRRMRAVAARG